MRDVVIVSALRTAIANFNGSLAAVSAADMAAQVIKEALNKANLKPEDVEEVILGNVLQAGQGQNPARQASVKAGIPVEVPSMTINKVCGSGLRTVSLAAQAIMLGDADVVVAGGMENMSQSPYILKESRWGHKMGHKEVVDLMIQDGLWCAFNDYHMGITAENLAEKYGITRQEQDTLAVASQNKAEKAQSEGKFVDEIVPIQIPQRKGDPIVFDKDEYIKYGTTLDKVAKLKPAFKKDGTVTAANASGINDGAAIVILMSSEKAEKMGIKPMAKIKSYGSAGVDPSIMGIGPVGAVKKALDRAGLKMEDMDLIEANEAFAAQALSVAKELNFDMDKVNVNGGAIALGHPIGASGARILVTLLHEMERRDSKYGLATLCIGGGQGTSLVVERI